MKLASLQVMGWVVVSMIASSWSATAHAQTPVTNWTERLTLGGNLAYRYQSQDASDTDLRERHRVRLRLTLDAKIDDEWTAHIGMTTGEAGNPRIPFQTMGEGFERKEFRLDIANLEYRPATCNGLSLQAGKMVQPWISVGELIWDPDLRPEGLSARQHVGSEGAEMMLHAGAFVAEERPADNDAYLYSGQAAVKFADEQKNYVEAGASVYALQNIEGYGMLNSGKSWGNSTRNLGTAEEPRLVYANGYQILEGFAEGGLELYFPVKFYGQYVVNPEADADNTAYLIGFAVGRAKAVNSVELGYNFRHLERDAVVGAFTDSDTTSNGGSCNGMVHKVYLKYQLAPRVRLTTTAYFANQHEAPGDQTRYQFDLEATF